MSNAFKLHREGLQAAEDLRLALGHGTVLRPKPRLMFPDDEERLWVGVDWVEAFHSAALNREKKLKRGAPMQLPSFTSDRHGGSYKYENQYVNIHVNELGLAAGVYDPEKTADNKLVFLVVSPLSLHREETVSLFGDELRHLLDRLKTLHPDVFRSILCMLNTILKIRWVRSKELNKLVPTLSSYDKPNEVVVAELRATLSKGNLVKPKEGARHHGEIVDLVTSPRRAGPNGYEISTWASMLGGFKGTFSGIPILLIDRWNPETKFRAIFDDSGEAVFSGEILERDLYLELDEPV